MSFTLLPDNQYVRSLSWSVIGERCDVFWAVICLLPVVGLFLGLDWLVWVVVISTVDLHHPRGKR